MIELKKEAKTSYEVFDQESHNDTKIEESKAVCEDSDNDQNNVCWKSLETIDQLWDEVDRLIIEVFYPMICITQRYLMA